MEDYTSKYKGEQVELALFGGDYQDGVLTAYCAVDDVPHIELNGHILIRSRTSPRCTARVDATHLSRTGLRAASPTRSATTRPENSSQNESCAARPRWAAPGVVLNRVHIDLIWTRSASGPGIHPSRPGDEPHSETNSEP